MTLLLTLLTGLASAQDADVRFLHLSPDAGDLEAYVGASLVATGVGYLEASAATAVPSGFQTISVAASGSGGVDPFASSLSTYDPGGAYALVAFGAQDTMSILSLSQDPSGIPAGANRYQVGHVAEGLPDIDVYLPSQRAVLLDDLPYGASDSIVDVAAGPFVLMLDVDDDSAPDYVFDMPDLGSDAQFELLLIGEEEDLSFVIMDAAGTVSVVDGTFIPKPTLQYIQLSPDLPPADLYVGFGLTPLFEDMTFGTASLPTAVSPGSQAFTLAPAGVPPTSPYGEGSGRIEAETDYTVFTYKTLAKLGYGKVKDLPDVPGEQPIRVLHLSMGIGPVSILIDGVPQPGFSRRGQGDVFTVPPGGFELGFDNTSPFDGVADIVFDVPDTGTHHINLFLASSSTFETKLYVDQSDGTLLVLDPQ